MVVLSLQRTRFVYLVIIDPNRQYRNSGGAIWLRTENRAGDFVEEIDWRLIDSILDSFG